ncbi:MAG: hypothetical protein IKN54_06200 [Lachnospiraceae bacterium]|nr:hypothetical protein [Lachnospiraceae bacterium]
MARLVNQSFLKIKGPSDSTFTELVAVVDSPDFGGEPETVDVTTQTDTKRRYINGLQDSSSLTFTCWYTEETASTLESIKQADKSITDPAQMNTYQYQIGVNGEHGIYEWKGKLDWYLASAAPGDAQQISITISDEGETELTWSATT